MSRQGIPFKIGQTFAPLSILDRVRIIKITIAGNDTWSCIIIPSNSLNPIGINTIECLLEICTFYILQIMIMIIELKKLNSHV